MLHKIDLKKILFLDIEIVPEVERFDQLSEETQKLWDAKSAYQRKEDQSPESFYERAGIWAEFGKIVCIYVGYFSGSKKNRSFRMKTFFGGEKELLIAFKELLENHFNHTSNLLCAHNGKEFDFPYIARRIIINNVSIPSHLNLFNKKPWEIPHLETLHLSRIGDYNHYTSLKLMAYVLEIPSPKDDIDGSQVAKAFYDDKDIDRIVVYCEKDIVTIAQVVLRLRNESLLTQNEIISI